MQATSATYRSLFTQANTYKEWRISVNGTQYGQDVIVKEVGNTNKEPRVSRPTFLDTPSVGNCYAAQFSCTFYFESSNIPRMATIIPSYRLRNGNQASEWITVGTFYVDVRYYDKASKTTDIVCYDDMLKTDGAEGKTYAELTQFDEWPQPMPAVVQEICTIVGIPLDARSTINTGAGYTIGYPNDYTMREVLGFVAAAHGGNFIISPARALRLISIAGSADTVTSLGHQDLVLFEAFSAWSKVTLYYGDEEAYEAGTDTGRTLEAEDPWAEQSTANGILSVISGVSYIPFSVSVCLLDPAAELGDTVVFPVGQSITVSVKLWNIDLYCDSTSIVSIGAPGESAVDHEYPYVSSSARQMRRMVKLGQPYYGVIITKTKGIEIKRSDGASEAIFNSDVFAMRAKIDGAMKDRIYFDPVRGDYVFDGALGVDAVFTESLYAELGYVSELTVDRLTTSRRVRKYLLGDTSDDNYIDIRDNSIRLITGSTVNYSELLTENDDPLLTEGGDALTCEMQGYDTVQMVNRYGQRLYWQREIVSVNTQGYPFDENNKQVYATTESTEWPVLSYKYEEQVKAQYAFNLDGDIYVPQIVLGAGDENGNSRGYLYKRQTDLLMRYVSSLGKNVDLQFSDEGFVDAMHRRLASCQIDRTNGRLTYTVEGSETEHTIDFDVDGAEVEFVWPDGHTCTVSVVEEEQNE